MMEQYQFWVVEHMKLTDCHYEKRDWRKCTAAVRDLSLGIELGGFGG